MERVATKGYTRLTFPDFRVARGRKSVGVLVVPGYLFSGGLGDMPARDWPILSSSIWPTSSHWQKSRQAKPPAPPVTQAVRLSQVTHLLADANFRSPRQRPYNSL